LGRPLEKQGRSCLVPDPWRQALTRSTGFFFFFFCIFPRGGGRSSPPLFVNFSEAVVLSLFTLFRFPPVSPHSHPSPYLFERDVSPFLFLPAVYVTYGLSVPSTVRKGNTYLTALLSSESAGSSVRKFLILSVFFQLVSVDCLCSSSPTLLLKLRGFVDFP